MGDSVRRGVFGCSWKQVLEGIGGVLIPSESSRLNVATTSCYGVLHYFKAGFTLNSRKTNSALQTAERAALSSFGAFQ